MTATFGHRWTVSTAATKSVGDRSASRLREDREGGRTGGNPLQPVRAGRCWQLEWANSGNEAVGERKIEGIVTRQTAPPASQMQLVLDKTIFPITSPCRDQKLDLAAAPPSVVSLAPRPHA